MPIGSVMGHQLYGGMLRPLPRQHQEPSSVDASSHPTLPTGGLRRRAYFAACRYAHGFRCKPKPDRLVCLGHLQRHRRGSRRLSSAVVEWALAYIAALTRARETSADSSELGDRGALRAGRPARAGWVALRLLVDVAIFVLAELLFADSGSERRWRSGDRGPIADDDVGGRRRGASYGVVEVRQQGDLLEPAGRRCGCWSTLPFSF